VGGSTCKKGGAGIFGYRAIFGGQGTGVLNFPKGQTGGKPKRVTPTLCGDGTYCPRKGQGRRAGSAEQFEKRGEPETELIKVKSRKGARRRTIS